MTRTSSVVESSDDGKMIWCKTCKVLYGHHNTGSGWIQKESLAYHLKSDAHTCSICAQCDRELIQVAGEWAMEEENMMEQEMDFVMLCPMAAPAVANTVPTRVLSTEEQNMWDNYALYNEHFDAGIDHAAATIDGRRRLERDVNNFNLWHAGAYHLPEEGTNDSELLLEELEQDNILNELLRNAHLSFYLHWIYEEADTFWSDLDALDVADILEEEVRGCAQLPKAFNEWSPYESKMVSCRIALPSKFILYHIDICNTHLLLLCF